MVMTEAYQAYAPPPAPVPATQYTISASDAGVSSPNQVKRFYNGKSIISGYLFNNSSSPVTVTLTYWVKGGISQTIVLLPNQTFTFENLPLENFIGNGSVEYAYVASHTVTGTPKVRISGGSFQDVAVFTSLPFTATATGKVILLLIGAGSVANLIVNSSTAAANAGNALVNGAWYEFEVHVASGDVVNISNATFVKGFMVAGE